jgi:hypothetical protein
MCFTLADDSWLHNASAARERFRFSTAVLRSREDLSMRPTLVFAVLLCGSCAGGAGTPQDPNGDADYHPQGGDAQAFAPCAPRNESGPFTAVDVQARWPLPSAFTHPCPQGDVQALQITLLFGATKCPVGVVTTSAGKAIAGCCTAVPVGVYDAMVLYQFREGQNPPWTLADQFDRVELPKSQGAVIDVSFAGVALNAHKSNGRDLLADWCNGVPLPK